MYCIPSLQSKLALQSIEVTMVAPLLDIVDRFILSWLLNYCIIVGKLATCAGVPHMISAQVRSKKILVRLSIGSQLDQFLQPLAQLEVDDPIL